MCLKNFLPSQASMSMIMKTHKENKILMYYRKKKASNEIMSFSVKMEGCYRSVFKIILCWRHCFPLSYIHIVGIGSQQRPSSYQVIFI